MSYTFLLYMIVATAMILSLLHLSTWVVVTVLDKFNVLDSLLTEDK